MKIGIAPLNVGPPSITSHLLPLAQHAEAAGVESFWTYEHVIVPVEYASTYPYSRDGKMPITPETCFVDPLIALTYVAAGTEKLKLGTGINILPQTNPLLLAKQAASLDALSGGRLLLGLGVGWLEEEFKAMGTPFARRGARFRDYVLAMKKVWSGEVVEHQSDFLSWSGFKSYPLPAQRPHPPLIIGGTSRPAMQRVVHLGDGWTAPSHTLEEFEEQLAALKAVADDAGRSMDSIEITCTWRPTKQPDALPRFRELGVSRLIVLLAATGERDPRVGIDRVMERANATM